MSIMIPQEPPAEMRISAPTKIATAVRKSTKSFFDRPVHILFYLLLAGMIIGLFMGRDFSWKLYIALFCLGISELYQNHSKKDAGISKQ